MRSQDSLQIRKALTDDDWSFVRRVCCETGNAGDPIERAREDFFAEFWVGPYEKLESAWTYIAWSGGKRVGYMTGCPNTKSHQFRKKFFFSLPLFLQTRIFRNFIRNADVERFEARFLGKQKSPEESYPPEIQSRLLSEFPAHLHINLKTEARGLGAGRRLIEAFSSDLRALGISGIHVHCGEKPVGFYLKTGFQEIGKIEFKPGVWVYALGLRL